jgi:Ca-activated chloride channel family protein
MRTRIVRSLALAAFLATPAAAMNCNQDAMLVFDASGSMAAMGFNGLDLPRIVEARDALRQALPEITPYRRMGLVVYGPGSNDACSNIELRFGPAPDAAMAIVGAVDRVTPDGDTPLTDAVRKAADVLAERGGDVVLVTDGRETCSGAPCQLAAELSGTDLTVHVIGFRVRGSSFEWKSVADVRNHQTVARCLADLTGGEYVSAESTDDLVRALREILGCPIVS